MLLEMPVEPPAAELALLPRPLPPEPVPTPLWLARDEELPLPASEPAAPIPPEAAEPDPPV